MIEEMIGDQIENERFVVNDMSVPANSINPENPSNALSLRASCNKRKFSPEEKGLFYFTTCEEIFVL